MSQPPILTKKQLIEKIHKEQNVPKKDLERLNVAALTAMDKVVPDEGDLLGGEPSELPTTQQSGVDQPSGQTSNNSETTGETLPVSNGNDGSNSQAPAQGSESNPAPAVPSENGTQVVAEVGGDARLSTQETPQQSTSVASEQGQGVPQSSLPSESRTDDVVEEPKERVLLGYHPVTEEPVYSDEQ